jgi:hypothetical protein
MPLSKMLTITQARIHPGSSTIVRGKAIDDIDAISKESILEQFERFKKKTA